VPAGDEIEFEMTLYLNIEPGFEGDIYLTLGGAGVRDYLVDDSVVIAEAISPISIDAQVTNIRIGYQFMPVGNFTIRENVAGALLDGEELWISITDEILTEMHIAPGFTMEVTEGNIDLRNVRVGTPVSAFMQGRRMEQIRIDVHRSSSVPSTIEFTNVHARLAAHAPVSNVGYDIIVWGPAVAANNEYVQRIEGHVNRIQDWYPEGEGYVRSGATSPFVNPRDLFSTVGFAVPYITLYTGDRPVLIDEIVVIPMGSNTITIGGRSVSIAPVAFVDATGTGLFPLRAISEALELPVRWDVHTSTAFIGEAGQVEFTVGSTIMRVGGVPVQIVNGAGDIISPAMFDIGGGNAAMMIPLRALGYALGMDVSWDAATSTATLTPPDLRVH
jgi:hypothetical protein